MILEIGKLYITKRSLVVSLFKPKCGLHELNGKSILYVKEFRRLNDKDFSESFGQNNSDIDKKIFLQKMKTCYRVEFLHGKELYYCDIHENNIRYFLRKYYVGTKNRQFI